MISFFKSIVESGLEYVSYDGTTTYCRVVPGQAEADLGYPAPPVWEVTKDGVVLPKTCRHPVDELTERIILDPNPVGLRIEGTQGKETQAIEIIA